MVWCKTEESEHGISYFKLLVSEEEFDKNVIWHVGWEVHYSSSVRREKWYGMSDGTIVHIGWLTYSLDSWCSEYTNNEGIKKLIESLKAELRRYEPIIYIAGNVPDEIMETLPRRLVQETQLPQRG
jgi:hypothetical protein